MLRNIARHSCSKVQEIRGTYKQPVAKFNYASPIIHAMVSGRPIATQDIDIIPELTVKLVM